MEKVSFCSALGVRDTDNERSSVDIAVMLLTYSDRNFQNQSPGSVDYTPLISFSSLHSKQTVFESFTISSEPAKTNQK